HGVGAVGLGRPDRVVAQPLDLAHEVHVERHARPGVTQSQRESHTNLLDWRRTSAGGAPSFRSPRAWGPQPPAGPAARTAGRRPAAPPRHRNRLMMTRPRRKP